MVRPGSPSDMSVSTKIGTPVIPLTSAVREAADRVRTALKNTGISMPPKKITVNLSPADTKKDGTGFDLAIAVAMMCSLGMFPKESIDNILFLGELGLNGDVKKIRGILPMVEMAKERGCRACVLLLCF